MYTLQNTNINKNHLPQLGNTYWFWGFIYNACYGKVGAKDLLSCHNVYLTMSNVVINMKWHTPLALIDNKYKVELPTLVKEFK